MVVGAGPAGSLVAGLLAKAGKRVLVFDIDKRPPLVVGESMLPAAIPILRRLGVEAAVRASGVRKPGASLTCGDATYPFGFGAAQGAVPSYAYNVPRDEFDAILRGAAIGHGATIHRCRATIEPDQRGGVQLTGDAAELAREVLGGAADVVVDATGRHALVERTLRVGHVKGTRDDVALFAHLDRAHLEHAGHIHVDRLERGWCWRIPLRDRVSVGVVIARRHLERYGDGASEQYDALLEADPRLARRVAGARRCTPVVKYTNYQRHAARLHGHNWVLVGDAAGFVDPIFSTGVYLALHGAQLAADALLAEGGEALFHYERVWLDELERWRRIIAHWYDGRLLSLLRVGGVLSRAPGGRYVDRHVSKHVTRIFTGEAGDASYSHALLEVLLPLGRPTQGRYAIA